MPLNSMLTLDVRYHNDDFTTPGFRDRLQESLHYAWGRPKGGLAGIYTWENSLKGGVGLHIHLQAYIPPDHFKEGIDRAVGVLAKCFSVHLDHLLDKHQKGMALHGIPPVGYRATTKQKYMALLNYRSSLIDKGVIKPLEEEESDGKEPFLQLPFYFSTNYKTYNKLPEKPLSPSDAIRIFTYNCKNADPTITYTQHGETHTLKEMSQKDGIIGWKGFKDACNLQDQSTRRFSRRTCAATRKTRPQGYARSRERLPRGS